MSAAAFLIFVQGLQVALSAAPQVSKLIVQTKEIVETLFTAGVITAQQQTDLNNYVDAVCTAALRGEVAPEWQVEADPT